MKIYSSTQEYIRLGVLCSYVREFITLQHGFLRFYFTNIAEKVLEMVINDDSYVSVKWNVTHEDVYSP